MCTKTKQKRDRPSLPVTTRVDVPTLSGALPAGTPLLAPTNEAGKIFGLSAATLYRLRARYPEFKALTIKTGKQVLYDVPKCYAWLGQYLGTELEVNSP